MASGDAQQKSEPPTPGRLRQARRQGDVWQSHDLTTTVTLVLMTVVLVAGAPWAIGWMVQTMSQHVLQALRPDAEVVPIAGPLFHFVVLVSAGAGTLLAVASALVSGLQVRGVFSVARVRPQLRHLNPVDGLRRIVSLRTLFELLRLLVKLLTLVAVLGVLSLQVLPLLPRSGHLPLPGWIALTGWHLQALLVTCCIAFGGVAVADIAFQRWFYLRGKRMSLDEVRREYREREGDPILRGRRKQMHQEIAMNDMLHQVRQASVVVVNPTHVAIALRYEPGTHADPLPRVVAKGQDDMARAIREAAMQAGVPVYRDVALARRLLVDAEPDDYIPDHLMEAVAHVLRWVERMKKEETSAELGARVPRTGRDEAGRP